MLLEKIYSAYTEMSLKPYSPCTAINSIAFMPHDDAQVLHSENFTIVTSKMSLQYGRRTPLVRFSPNPVNHPFTFLFETDNRGKTQTPMFRRLRNMPPQINFYARQFHRLQFHMSARHHGKSIAMGKLSQNVNSDTNTYSYTHSHTFGMTALLGLRDVQLYPKHK